jgi:GTP cyclohydrolase I
MKILFTNNSVENSLAKPDIANTDLSNIKTTLNLVGMSNVELPILIKDISGKTNIQPAICELFVSLDDMNAKGIHMSRLYLHAQDHLAKNSIGFESLRELCEIFISSHADLSSQAKVIVNFDYMSLRPALKSDKSGWRFYPVTISAQKINQKNFVYELDFEILYSSTCPCSAALAREINKEAFIKHFKNESDISKERILEWLGSLESQSAVPHAQRSSAKIKLKFKQIPTDDMKLDYWIDLIENTLKTPVQAAVKREDEQEFARLNGQNFMFSEDACRLIKNALEYHTEISAYHVEVSHKESLHPHNAVAVAHKNFQV